MGKKEFKKVDVYAADKTLVDRIGEFVVCHTQYINIKTKYDAKVKSYKSVLADKMREDRVWVDEEQKATSIAAAQKDLDDIEAERKDLIDKHARFRYTAGDDAFYNTYSTATEQSKVEEAFVEWCAFYNLKTEASDLLNSVMIAIGGKGKLPSKQHVQSVIAGEVKFNGSRKKREVLDVMYGEIAEYFISKGRSPMPEFDAEVIKKYGKKN